MLFKLPNTIPPILSKRPPAYFTEKIGKITKILLAYPFPFQILYIIISFL